MTPAYYSLIAAGAVMLVSLAGILFSAAALRRWMQHNLTYLATFAGGVFLVVVYHLFTELIHERASAPLIVGSILIGIAVMMTLHRLMPESHHHHEMEHDHAHTHIDGRRVLLSDAFHNIGDGVLLVASFAVNVYVGLAAAVGILVHELVQEVSEFFVLRESGYAVSRALMLNLLSSSTILIGVGIATYLSSAESIALLFAGIATGGFLAILVQDLIPHALHSIRKDGGAHVHVFAAICGASLMLFVQTIFHE